jgi:fucose 4-O-acetylase-like acetyltransferase
MLQIHTPEPAPPPTTSPGTPPPPARRSKPRDPFFDNAKYLAIVLVAMAHSWEPLRSDSRAVTAAYTVVYAFHMPAFIIISGYLSRGFNGRPEQIKRLLTGLVVPYVVFETAYSLVNRWAGGNPGYPVSLVTPYFLTWFLIALFIWRITSPIWRMVRWPLPLALLIAALATTSPSIGTDLDLQRVLQFLPYFVLGLSLRPEHFQLARRRAVRIAAVPVFACTLVFAYWAVSRMNYAWFFHRDAAQDLGAPWWVGPLMTLGTFACGLVLVGCFFSLVPGRATWFTALGAGTLYGYLLHGFLIKAADYTHVFATYDWLHSPLGEVFVTVLAGAVVTVLCMAPFRRTFRFVMEPDMRWVFRPPAPKVNSESR